MCSLQHTKQAKCPCIDQRQTLQPQLLHCKCTQAQMTSNTEPLCSKQGTQSDLGFTSVDHHNAAVIRWNPPSHSGLNHAGLQCSKYQKA
jgi:hypothetical protein